MDFFLYFIAGAKTSNSSRTSVFLPGKHCTQWQYRVVKCDVTKIKISEPMRFVEIIREIKTKNVSLPRISMLVQIVGEILVLPQLCFNDSIQILLKMAWFLMLGTKPI